MHTASAGAREPRVTLLRQGPEAEGPAPARQKDSWIDTKAQERQRNHGQGWGDNCKEGKRLQAGVDGNEQNGWRQGENPRGGGEMETEGWKEKGWGAAEVNTAKRMGRILLELTTALLGEIMSLRKPVVSKDAFTPQSPEKHT